MGRIEDFKWSDAMAIILHQICVLIAGWSYFEVRTVELFTTAAAAPIIVCSGGVLLCFGELWLKNTVMVIWGRSVPLLTCYND